MTAAYMTGSGQERDGAEDRSGAGLGVIKSGTALVHNAAAIYTDEVAGRS